MRKDKVAVNTVANLASRAWTVLANYLFVPFYIMLLGEEAYGLITFFATLQTALNLLGLGLSKTLRREFAAHEESGKDTLYKYKVLRSVESVYFVIAILIIGICFFGATYISNRYLEVNQIPIETVVLTIRLMGCSIAAQLVGNLYLGCLFGQEKQVLADSIQIAWSAIKNVGVVPVVALISTSISTFYIWHVVVDMVYLLVLRGIVIIGLKKRVEKLEWSFREITNLKNIWKFALGIMVISVGYAINTQADKMIITGSFPLIIVGAYNSAYNLGYAASIFVAAMGIAVFPRFTRLFSIGRGDDLKKEYIRVNRLSTIITVSIGMYVAVFSYELLLIWTRSTIIADTMRIAAIPLIIGTMMNALQEIPYNYYLANGITLVNNIMTMCSIIYVVVVTPIMIESFGILGASLSWFVQMLLFTTIYLFAFYHKFFKESIVKRLLGDTLMPIVLTGASAVVVHWGINSLSTNPAVIVTTAIVGGLLNLIMLYLLFCKRSDRTSS